MSLGVTFLGSLPHNLNIRYWNGLNFHYFVTKE